ncbi:hypothetical protein [Moorena sp. SIO4G3]|uniref:hypothetical protein n=1 Tax=Moorena sp. SIO4G3 TaxID=2607821 RepID=UPI00142B3CE4|nr:hypothetical protein [Moorena sp. SIO4G3]NEO77662.1 hypothetical protein [Moorena sp. SIO4G3]
MMIPETNPLANLDIYDLKYLVYHVADANLVEDLHALLTLETDNQGLALFEAKDIIGEAGSFLTDLAIAWKEAEKEFEIGNKSRAISRQFRYALLTATYNSLATNIPTELMLTLAKYKFWSPEQCFNHIKQLEDLQSSKQINLLLELITEEPELLSTSLDLIRSNANQSDKIWAFLKLLEIFPDNSELFSEALESIINHDKRLEKVKQMIKLLPYVQDKNAILLEAIESTINIDKESDKREALTEITPHLSRDFMPTIGEIVIDIQDKYELATVLKEIGSQFPEILPVALEAAQCIQDKSQRASALKKLASKLPTELIPSLLLAANDLDRAEEILVWTEIPEHLPANVFPNLLSLIGATNSPYDNAQRMAVLSNLAPHLPETLMSQALDFVDAIPNGVVTSLCLKILAPYLPKTLQTRVLQVINNIQFTYENTDVTNLIQAQAFVYLVSYFPEIIPQAMENISKLEDSFKAENITEIACKFQENELFLELALDSIGSINNELQDKADLIAKLSSHIPDLIYNSNFQKIILETLIGAKNIKTINERNELTKKLAPHLPKNLVAEALITSRIIYEDQLKLLKSYILLTTYAPELDSRVLALERYFTSFTQSWHGVNPESDIKEMLGILSFYFPNDFWFWLSAVFKSYSEQEMITCLTNLIPVLSQECLLQSLKTVIALENSPEQQKFLREIIPFIPISPNQKIELIPAKDIEDQTFQEVVLSKPTSYSIRVASDQLIKSCEYLKLEKYNNTKFATTSLVDIITYMFRFLQSESGIPLDIKLSSKIHLKNELQLIDIIPYCTEELIIVILNLIENGLKLGIAWWALADNLPLHLIPKALELIPTKAILPNIAFNGLAPRLTKKLMPLGLESALSIKDTILKAESLRELSPYLPNNLVYKILDFCKEIREECQDKKASLLGGISPQLIELDPENTYNHWHSIIYPLSAQPRQYFLREINGLSSLIVNLGGTEAIEESAKVIEDIIRWFP